MNPEEFAAWQPFLKRLPLFADLSSEDLDKISARLQLLSLPRGAALYREGDEPDAMYILVSGQARRLRTVDGVQTLAAYLGRGDAAGETGLLTGIRRTSTVRLDTTSDVLKLPRKDFEEILRDHPTILWHLSRILAQRIIDQGPAPRPAEFGARLIVLDPALPRPDRAALAWGLGFELAAQTRRRVLVVDAAREPGLIAREADLSAAIVGETELRGANLRDPEVLSALAQAHPSGVRVLSLSSSALGGRLLPSLYHILNSLRGACDFALVALDGVERGGVERAALSEADRVLMAGCDAMRPEFRQMEAELPGLVPEPARLLRLWLGELELDGAPLREGAERVSIPWEGAESAADPKPRAAIARLARRLAGVRVGLALGSGAALGHAAIGVLKVFLRAGVPIDVVTGTSMGSLIGGLFAAGYAPEEIEKLAGGIDKAWVIENLLWDLTFPRSGFFTGRSLLRFLRSHFGSREFSDLDMPFACVAADARTGVEVVLKSGRVAEAVRASCGVPMIFRPYQINGRWLMDGGLVNPVPTRVLADLGADVLIAVNLTMPAVSPRAKLPLGLPWPPGIFDIFFRTLYTMEFEIAESRVGMAHVALHPDLEQFSWTELHRAREIVAIGEKTAEEALPRIKALIPALRPDASSRFQA